MPQEYTASDRVISVRAGGDFVVVLAANPTTGHEWEAHFDAALVQLIDRVLAASGSGIGSGGTERFRFKALGPGDGQLRMTCRRPWESAPVQELVFELHIGA
jgi:inhibitor of cysteine peptidase